MRLFHLPLAIFFVNIFENISTGAYVKNEPKKHREYGY